VQLSVFLRGQAAAGGRWRRLLAAAAVAMVMERIDNPALGAERR